MNRLSIKIFLCSLGFAAALLITGCGGGSSNNGNPNTTISVVVFPGTGNAKTTPGGTINFTATVFNFTANGGVTWTAASGTIVNSTSNTATYMAPASGATDTVTATSAEDTTKSASVTVNITAMQALTITPGAAAVAAGGTLQFSASGGAQAVTWTLPPPPPGENFGSIDSNTGLYTAPPSPPPGGAVVVTATAGASSGTATVTVLFGSASLCDQCKYVFSYSGIDSAFGVFLASAGNFRADANGNIVNDGTSFVDLTNGTGDIEGAVQGGTYSISPDGRGTINVITSQGSFTLQVALTSSQHGLVVRFDSLATGSGTLDIADEADFSESAVSGSYAFGLSGVDSGGFSLNIAGRFLSVAPTGNFPQGNAIQDVNDAGVVTTADTSLHGNITSFDSSSGRGLLEFQSTPGGTLTFVFYIVDTSHLKLVEADQAPILGGDAFSAPDTITLASLPAGSDAFTLGGAGSAGPFAAGGVFTSNGNGGITGGVFDQVNNGSASLGKSVSSSSTYSLSPNSTSNRIQVTLNVGNSTFMFGVYPTSSGTAELVEIDALAVSGGLAFAQNSTATPQGSFAFNITGAAGGLEEDVIGSVATTATSGMTGFLDVNVTGATFMNNPLASSSSIAAPSAFGRGPLSLITAAPSSATFGLNYYTIDANQALVLETDGSVTALGVVVKQF